jgi:hypothetical protein
MAARHWQWRGTNAPLLVTSLLKRATASDVFVSRYLFVRVFIVIKNLF